MIRLLTLRIIDYVVVGVSGACFLLFLGCALYAVPWNRERRKQSYTKDFSVFWKTRLFLLLASALWLLLQWLRLMALWQPGSQIFPESVTNWTGGGQLCRLYLCLSVGLLEPFCIFTAVLLCRSVLSKRRLKDSGWPNAWVVGLALVATAPFTAANVVAAWMSVLIPGRTWETKETAGRYFLAAYVAGTPQQCEQTSEGRTIIAAIPAFLAALLLWLTIQRMIGAVINRRLRRRLRAFQLLMFMGLVACNALRAITLIRGTPFAWVFQMLWLAHFLSIPFLVIVYTLFLVIIPVRDTVRASKDIQRVKRQPSIEQPAAERSKRSGTGEGIEAAANLSPQTRSERAEDTLLTVRNDGATSLN